MSIASEIQRIKTNIANAYTQANEKGATLPEQQNSANLASTIESISSGGGTPVSVQRKDINFYDYDGTRLYSYTLAEVQELTKLPELPSHEGLICQDWNWTLADIKAEGKETDVGAMYITDDDKTRLYIRISAEERMTVPLCFQQSVANGVEVDWGDGSAVETFAESGSTNILPIHTYKKIGEYVITLNPSNNCKLTLGSNNDSYCIIGSNTYDTIIYKNMLYKIEIGNNVASIGDYTFCNCCSLLSITIPNNVTRIGDYAIYNCCSLLSITIPNNVTSIGDDAFGYCCSLSSIIIPNNVTRIGDYAFRNCYPLSSITIPNNVTSIGAYTFYYCCSLSSITIPNNVTSIGTYTFYICCSLSSITIPNNVTSIGDYAFKSCYPLSSIIIPNNVTSIGAYAFHNCYSLSSIIIPNNVTSIGVYTFYNCCGMKFYDFSSHTAIPTLSNTNAFTGIPSDCRIIVPDNLYASWRNKTNWSTYASKIIKKSDWDAL